MTDEKEPKMDHDLDTLTAKIHEALLIEHFQNNLEHVRTSIPHAYAAYADPESDFGAKARRIAQHVFSPGGES